MKNDKVAYASVPAAPTAGRDTCPTQFYASYTINTFIPHPLSLILHPFLNPVGNVPIKRISSNIIITLEASNNEITTTCLDSRLRGKDRKIASSLRSSQ